MRMSDRPTGTGNDAERPSPFAFRSFFETWAGNMISNLGGMIQLVGASWMMTSLTSSQQMVALIHASTAFPLVLLALIAGAVADNFDRRKVMLVAQAFMLVASAVLAVLAWIGGITPWLLLCLTFLIGCGNAFKIPAWQASVSEMVPRAALPGAVAYNSMGFNIARSAGPAIGGAVVAAAGPAWLPPCSAGARNPRHAAFRANDFSLPWPTVSVML
jgi:MFS family permease